MLAMQCWLLSYYFQLFSCKEYLMDVQPAEFNKSLSMIKIES